MPRRPREVEMPEVEVPEIEVPEVEVPEIGVPEVETLEAEVPEAEVPEAGAPEVGASEAGRSGTPRRRYRPSSVLWVANRSDPDTVASLALARLTSDHKVSMKSAGVANEKALAVLTKVLSEFGKAQWLADKLGGRMPGVVATVTVSWIERRSKTPAPAIDIVIHLEDEE